MFSAEVCIASQKDGAEELADNNKNFSSVIFIIKTFKCSIKVRVAELISNDEWYRSKVQIRSKQL